MLLFALCCLFWGAYVCVFFKAFSVSMSGLCIESGLALFFLLLLNGGWTDLVADVDVEVAGATASHLQVLLF